MSDLPTGLALREAVAREVMGLHEVRKERDLNYSHQERYCLEYLSRGSGRPSGQAVGMDGGDYWREVPYYETDIAAAWRVVERMRGKQPPPRQHPYRLTIKEQRDGSYYVTFTGDYAVRMGGAEHGSLATAICQAALVAERDRKETE